MHIFSSIPPKRLLLYLMLSGLIPIMLAVFIFSSELENVNILKNKLNSLQELAFSREKKQSSNIAVRSHFQGADHFYIDKQLETISLLNPEVDSLNKMLGNPNFPHDENIKKRLESLSGQSNKLVFTEGVVQSTQNMQEVTETLVHPVEVNVSDIKQILCKIEGVDIGGECKPLESRPQLIILDFKIEKKNVSEKNQVFLLNLKLLKREYL